MALLDEINEMVGGLEAHTAQIVRAFNQKRQAATEAINSLKFGGYTLAQVRALMGTRGSEHIARRDNPHQDTAAGIGAYTRSEFDELDNDLLDAYIVPLSRWGSLDYLPPGVGGSYEGATVDESYKRHALQLEDDDTLVILRPGTNGSSRGLYYTYMRNASNDTWSESNLVRTNRRYHPSYLTANQVPVAVYGFSESVVYGPVRNPVTRAVEGLYVSLTQGTFNDQLHTGGLIPSIAVQPIGGAVRLGDDVVFFSASGLHVGDGSGNWTPGIQVHRVGVSELIAGSATGLSTVTGITSVGWHGTTVEDGLFRFAGVSESANAADKPFLLFPSAEEMGSYQWKAFFHYQPTAMQIEVIDTQRVRVKVVAHSGFVYGIYTSTSHLQFSFIYDHSTRTATLDEDYLAQNSLTRVNGQYSAFVGPMFDKSPSADGYWYTGSSVWASTLSSTGRVFRVGYNAGVDDGHYTRSQVDAWTSRAEALRHGSNNNQAGAMTNYQPKPQFGSPVGSVMTAPVALSNTKLMAWANGRRADGTQTNGLVVTELEGAGYAYDSINHGTLLGYAPSGTRAFVADLGKTESEYYASITEVSSGGTVRCSTTRYAQALRLAGYAQLDDALELSDPASISQSVLDQIRDHVVSVHYSGNLANLRDYRVEVIVPQLLSAAPLGVVLALDTTNNIDLILVELAIAQGTANGDITQMSMVQTSAKYRLTNNDGVNLVDTAQGQIGTCNIYETTSSFLVGFSTIGCIWTSGVISHVSVFARYLKTGSYDFTTNPLASPAVPGLSGWGFYASATQGFGRCMYQQDLSDSSTKLVFFPLSNGADVSLTTDLPPVGSRVVLAAQDVPQGFLVYFTELTPVFIAGRYYELEPTTIDLTTLIADPSNTTFYVYVKMVQGTPRYRVSLTELPESYATMYIGTLTTDDVRIATLTFDKVTRLDTFRVSTMAVGSAIPVSSGLPTTPTTLEWK